MKLEFDLSGFGQEIARIVREEVAYQMAEYEKKLKGLTPELPVQYYNISQVSQKLKFSRNTIYKLIDQGKLQAVVVYNHKRITSKELDRFTQQMIEKRLGKKNIH